MNYFKYLIFEITLCVLVSSISSEDPRGLELKLNSRAGGGGGSGGGGRKLGTGGKNSHNCRKNDSVAQQACLEYCTHFKSYRKGECSEDEGACLCRSQGRKPLRVKLYKPVEKVAIASKKVMTNRGDFDCDGSLEAKSICHVYCELRASTSSECAKDGKSCLCYASLPDLGKSYSRLHLQPRRRESRDVVIGEETVLGSGRRRRPQLSSRPVQLSPYLPGCNSNSCVGKCPWRCDSLCTLNMECFCSCPEDEAIFYDYPAAGAGPGPDYGYDVPFFG